MSPSQPLVKGLFLVTARAMSARLPIFLFGVNLPAKFKHVGMRPRRDFLQYLIRLVRSSKLNPAFRRSLSDFALNNT
jgi:hypothetical protein